MENNPDKTPQPTQVVDIQPPKPVQVVNNEMTSASVEPPASDVVPKISDVESTSPTQNDTPALAATTPVHKSRRTPILSVIVAIVVAGTLGVLAIMAYVSSNQLDKQSTPTGVNNTKEDELAPTSSAIDDATTSIDEALKTTDTEDFNEATIDDTTLGL